MPWMIVQEEEEKEEEKEEEGVAVRKVTSGVMLSASRKKATAAVEPRVCASWLKLGRAAGAKSRHARMASDSAEGQDDGRALISSGSSFSYKTARMMSPAE